MTTTSIIITRVISTKIYLRKSLLRDSVLYNTQPLSKGPGWRRPADMMYCLSLIRSCAHLPCRRPETTLAGVLRLPKHNAPLQLRTLGLGDLERIKHTMQKG